MGTEVNLANGLEVDKEKGFRYQMYYKWMKKVVNQSYLELYSRDGLR